MAVCSRDSAAWTWTWVLVGAQLTLDTLVKGAWPPMPSARCPHHRLAPRPHCEVGPVSCGCGAAGRSSSKHKGAALGPLILASVSPGPRQLPARLPGPKASAPTPTPTVTSEEPWGRGRHHAFSFPAEHRHHQLQQQLERRASLAPHLPARISYQELSSQDRC